MRSSPARFSRTPSAAFAALSSVQFDRAVFLMRMSADDPLRTPAPKDLQQRDTLRDAVFYDIGVVTSDETPQRATAAMRARMA